MPMGHRLGACVLKSGDQGLLASHSSSLLTSEVISLATPSVPAIQIPAAPWFSIENFRLCIRALNINIGLWCFCQKYSEIIDKWFQKGPFRKSLSSKRLVWCSKDPLQSFLLQILPNHSICQDKAVGFLPWSSGLHLCARDEVESLYLLLQPCIDWVLRAWATGAAHPLFWTNCHFLSTSQKLTKLSTRLIRQITAMSKHIGGFFPHFQPPASFAELKALWWDPFLWAGYA